MKAVATSTRRQVQLCIGKAGLPVGSLVYVRQGRRENSAIAYGESWLANPERFNVSADLQLALGYQVHKAASPHDSVFHGAIADTAPDAWGRRVIARDHAKRRKNDPGLPALTELDYLLAVDDFSRVGALRLRDPPAWNVEGRAIYVCENPNLVAIAADCLGARCAPLVCTDGMPAAAQRTLLDQLARAGARLHYHGDFDWPGLRIANHVLRTWQAQPWQMRAPDYPYEAAVQTAPPRPRDLTASDLTAAWDPQLVPAMCRHGLSIAEEAVADRLIKDLRFT